MTKQALNTVRTLTKTTGTFDRVNTYPVMIYNPILGRSNDCYTVSLYQGKQTEGDGIYWLMLHAGVIAATYSAEEVAERDRLNATAPIVAGEIVKVAGEKGYYRVNLLGDYSDAATLEPVTLTPRAERALKRYGFAACAKAYRMNVEGFGASGIVHEGPAVLATVAQADAAIDAGREFAAFAKAPGRDRRAVRQDEVAGTV